MSPLRYAYRNVLIGRGGEAAGLYRLGMSSYPFLPVDGKWALARRLQRLAEMVAADFSLWRVSRAYPAEQYVGHTTGLLDARHQDREAWQELLAGHEQRLHGLGSHVAEVYLAVSLAGDTDPRVGGGLLRQVDRLRRRVEELAGVAVESPITTGELEALVAREQRTYERISGVVQARRARTDELQWLLRRAVCRGISEPNLDRHWQPDALVIQAPAGGAAFQPLRHDLARCVNAAITEYAQALTVESEQGCSHQAMLAVGALAEAPRFPGAAAEVLSAPLEALPWPVDAVLHARWLGNRQALAAVRRRIADVEHAYSEQAQGAAFGPSLRAGEDRLLAREYEAQLQAGGQPPMLYAEIGLAVGAPSEQELERRVAALREQYGDIQLHRPVGLQHQLWLTHLPRPDGWLAGVRDYVQQVTVEQFGAMTATATSQVGSQRGPYLGYTVGGTPRPVRYDPTQAPRENRASAVLLVGTLGSGKTVAAQAISYAAERRGSLIVDFDPKPDHGWERVPELDGRLAVVELSGDPVQRGRLDPLSIGFEDMREELACSYLLDLLPGTAGSWEAAVSLAVRDAVASGATGLNSVVDLLLESDRRGAREAGEALEVLRDFGLARLAFGDGTQQAASAQRPVTTIRMPGLSLPEPSASRETYTRAERVSVATLSLVAAYSLRLVREDPSRHKIVALDEIWFLLASPQGRAIINRLVRLGRSFNATVLLGTQRVADLGDLQDLIGVVLVFGADSDPAAEAALRLIGLQPTRELVALVRELRAGRCLMRDLAGRVGDVQVDLVYPELLRAFSTTPEQSREAT